MSLKYFGETGYGLFLNEEEAEEMAVAVENVDGLSDITTYNLTDLFDGSRLDDDWYDARIIRYLDHKEHSEGGGCFVCGVFFYAERQGEIVRWNDNSPSPNIYRSLDEMADEFKEHYGKYLPEDFDFKDHLVSFIGAVHD